MNQNLQVSAKSTVFVLLVFSSLAFFASNTSPAAPAVAEAPTASELKTTFGAKWVRLKHDKKDNLLALEVAIVRYVPERIARKMGKNGDYSKAPAYVDLVSAIHVGDRRYYERLNKRFRIYDAVLYELVAPEGTVVERGRGTSNTHPLGALQNGMKSMLELEHQLEIIDYTKPNFIHADLTPEEFSKSMSDRDESFIQMYFRMAGQAVALQSEQAAKGESADLDFMTALFAQDRPRRLKMAFAKQFESMESLLTSISGPKGSTLITVRNQRALEVLRDVLDRGKKKMSIFYGAGHLVDMHERLVKDFGLVPVASQWVEAWDLRP